MRSYTISHVEKKKRDIEITTETVKWASELILATAADSLIFSFGPSRMMAEDKMNVPSNSYFVISTTVAAVYPFLFSCFFSREGTI